MNDKNLCGSGSDSDSGSINIHAEHRKRIKERFVNHGLSEFCDHEILELLLYYALPRKDTNKLGHTLIKTFGSLSAVFDAPVSELCKVPGISMHSAILLKMVPQLAAKYISDSNKETKVFDDYENTGKYFTAKFIGSVNEQLYAAYFDNGMHLIDCVLMSSGDVNSSHVSPRAIASHAVAKNASFVIMAHNHPGGTVIPSADDLNTTRVCASALDIIGAKLVEHYIVAGNNYMGIMKMREIRNKLPE